jgi:competence protein ComEC
MRVPFAWIALGAVVGSWVWPLWRPDPTESTIATVLMAVILLLSPTRLMTMCLLISGFLLGTTAVGNQIGPRPTQQHLLGEVLERSGRTARVRTASGTVFIDLSTPPPAVGTTITAWVKERHTRAILPGAWDPKTTRQRFKASSLRAIEWAPIGPTTKPPPISIHHPYSGVLLALSTGDRSQIDQELKQLMRRTGTIHLLSISGLHVGMMAAFGTLLFWTLSRPLVLYGWPTFARILTFIGSTGTACAYGQLVGWPVSTQRAAWMVAAVSLAALLERTPNAWQLLGLAALAVLLNEPAQVGSLSFILSFGAVAGLIGWVPVLTSWIPPNTPRLVRWFTSSICATIAAMLGTSPVSFWVFQELSPSSPLANLVVVPIFAGLVVPAALLGANLPQGWGDLLLSIAASGIDLSYQWLKLCDWGTISPAISPFGALLLSISVLLYSRPRWAVLLALLSFAHPTPLKSSFEVIFPAVGQGSAALITWPNGDHWLIDGGPPGRSLLHWLRRSGIRKIDTVFLTHPDNDHIGGLLPIIDGMEVGHLWSPRRPMNSEKSFRSFWLQAAKNGVTLHLSSEDHPNIIYPTAASAPIDALTDNDMSLVLLVQHGQHRFLFTGDISRKIEKQLIDHIGPMTVVQVPHHGSTSSSSMAFVNKTRPSIAVIQAGKGNRFGHPHPTIIQRWNPKRVVRTDKYGSIRVRSNGENLHVDHWTSKTGWVSVAKQFDDRR